VCERSVLYRTRLYIRRATSQRGIDFVVSFLNAIIVVYTCAGHSYSRIITIIVFFTFYFLRIFRLTMMCRIFKKYSFSQTNYVFCHRFKEFGFTRNSVVYSTGSNGGTWASWARDADYSGASRNLLKNEKCKHLWQIFEQNIRKKRQ